MIAASRALPQVNAGTRLRKSLPVYQKAAEEFAVIVILLRPWGAVPRQNCIERGFKNLGASSKHC